MIGQHNIVKLAEGRLRAERFVIMRIKPRRKNAVSAQRVEQILVLDERTAADVDEDRRRFISASVSLQIMPFVSALACRWREMISEMRNSSSFSTLRTPISANCSALI